LEAVTEFMVPIVDEFVKRLEESLSSAVGWFEDKINRLIDYAEYNELIYLSQLPPFCYSIIRATSELVVEMKRVPIDITVDLSPNSSTTQEFDLTSTQFCGLIPVFTASSSIGPAYSRITILVNKEPIPDLKYSSWLNVLAHQGLHVPTEGPALPFSFYLTYVPVRRLHITFENRHSTESNTIAFYTECFELPTRIAYPLIDNMFMPIKRKVEEKIFGRLREKK